MDARAVRGRAGREAAQGPPSHVTMTPPAGSQVSCLSSWVATLPGGCSCPAGLPEPSLQARPAPNFSQRTPMHPPRPTSKLTTSMKPSQLPQAFPATPTLHFVA